jgi:hypothetical protein
MHSTCQKFFAFARIFGVSWKKSPKTPVETNGFNTSLARLWCIDSVAFSHANRILRNFGQNVALPSALNPFSHLPL